MGGGGSKSLAPPGGSIHSRERRLSHVDTNPPPQSEKLVECPSCSRSFASDRVDKHVEVCVFLVQLTLDILFFHITTFIKVRVAFIFGLQKL